MTLGKKLEIVELALYGNVDEVKIASYSISEQKIFYMKRSELLAEHDKLVRQIQDLGAEYDVITSPKIPTDIPIGFGWGE